MGVISLRVVARGVGTRACIRPESHYFWNFRAGEGGGCRVFEVRSPQITLHLHSHSLPESDIGFPFLLFWSNQDRSWYTGVVLCHPCSWGTWDDLLAECMQTQDLQWAVCSQIQSLANHRSWKITWLREVPRGIWTREDRDSKARHLHRDSLPSLCEHETARQLLGWETKDWNPLLGLKKTLHYVYRFF
jgi:hypothetical protein